jgi:phytoene desaturase
MSRVVVAGAGIGGLAVAARLSAAGHSVRVIEQCSTYGGKLSAVCRDGFVFDSGPSLLTIPAVYRDLFRKTAVTRRNSELEDYVDLVPVDPSFRYRFPDGTSVDIPDASRDGLRRALDDALGQVPGVAGGDGGDIHASPGTQWSRLLIHAADVWEITRGPFLERPIERPATLLAKAARMRDLRTVQPLRTLRGTGRRRLTDPRLRMMLDRYATYSGSDPRRAPAALVVIPYVEQAFGAWHVKGGVHRLATATYDRCVERGIDFRFDQTVAELTVEGGRVSGVRLASGETVPADVVVSDLDAAQLYRHLVPEQVSERREPLRRLGRSTPSSSCFCLFLAVRGNTRQIRHHTVLFGTDYDAEFDAIFGPRPRPPDDPTVYICSPDDQTMRPDAGHEAWSVLVNVPRHRPPGVAGAGSAGIDWDEPGLAERYADHVLDVLASRGVDVRDRILWRVVRTPADLERATGSPGGSVYGTSSNGARAAFLRPANRSPVRGLFLVGGSAHPGGGLPLVGMSAEIVAGLIGPA